MSFFNQKGRHRRGTKTQFHQHHHVPITPLTSFCHSSTESSKEKPSEKYNSPSVCNDANCQKERKCYCCYECNNEDGDKTKELRNVVTDVSNNCNLIKPKQENLTYKHVLKTSKRAYENVKSMFSYSDRNKALANKCNVVKVAPMGSTVGVIKNLTDCSDAVVEQETVATVKKSYAHNKYESTFPDLNSGERTDTLKQKVKFENLRDDTTAYYVDENLEGLKYQVTKVAPNSNGVGVSVVNAESYSELYDLAKGFSLCSKDTTDCFINGFLSTDPRESWVQEYTEIDYSNYTTVTDISADGTRFVNKLNEPNAGKSILKTISQSTKASGLSDTRRNYNISKYIRSRFLNLI